jgi:Cd2+/Zn2+-exporting ATPase
MNDPRSTSKSHDPCVVRLVVDAMRRDPSLEAVRLDHRDGDVSVATLGTPRDPQLARHVAEQLQPAPPTDPPVCRLLLGDAQCQGCPEHDTTHPSSGVRIDHLPGQTTISRITCPTAPSFWRWKRFPFPKLVPREVRLPEDESAENEWKPQLAAALACGAAGVTGALLGGTTVGILAYAVSYLAGSWFPAQEVLEKLRERRLDIHFLMLAVAAGAASIGAWGEGSALLFLFSLSGALEHYALGRTHREIRALIRTAPREATVRFPDGTEHPVPVEHLQPGHRLLLKPGQAFPVDAEVVLGATAADESNLTGEAAPVEKQVGDTVLGGTLNVWGAIEAVVLRPASHSALQRIIHLIRDSQKLRAPSQRFTDRFGTGYTVGILALTLSAFMVWWGVLGYPAFFAPEGQRSAFYLAMTLLVVASPCALVLSIPSAILAAVARAARHGVLFRGGAAVENLADVNWVALDKTGTLTTGELRVDRIESYPPGRESEVAELACAVERHSTHPLARALTRHGKRHGWGATPVEQVTSVSGQGVTALAGGRPVRLGRRAFALDLTQASPSLLIPPPAPMGTSEVWIAQGNLTGRILLRDDLRPESREVVDRLRTAGLRTVALTGDRKATGDHLQEQLKLDEVRTELHPEDKVAAIVAWSRAGHRVAMIGDGVNDAPALAAAHVGVAMGARGSDAALEQADLVLMHDRLENFEWAYHLSRQARRIIRQNLAVSLGTLALLAALALTAQLPLSQGVLGHEGSTVLVVLNSLRLLFASHSPRRR